MQTCGTASGASSEVGSAGGGKNRTSWDITLTVGIPFSRWGAVPFVLLPFPFPRDAAAAVHATEKARPVYASVHPFQMAQRWRQELMADPQVTKARIAAREGLSRARVTQIMNLLLLPKEISDTLLNPPESLHIGVFSERRLRELLSQSSPTAQLDFWQAWLQELRSMKQD